MKLEIGYLFRGRVVWNTLYKNNSFSDDELVLKSIETKIVFLVQS